ncbi:MAG: YbaN family protein [Oscillospiraceae bacterium]|jgi:uncharacterized membrane protein YbaN (DUF454 family)|nr:YbaN family protein [Oscillospiraceae bacterium]
MNRRLGNILGGAALAFGALGLVLPVLPTTPFVLCAAGCFSAANPRLYKKLANGRYFGEFIRNYREKSGVSRGVKLQALIFLWGALTVSALLVDALAVRAILAAVGVCVTAHILLLRERKS